MTNVVIWSLAGSLAVFGVGLVSAIASRAQRVKVGGVVIKSFDATEAKQLGKTLSPYAVTSATTVTGHVKPTTAMSMAASGGQLNGEENLAQVGSHSR
jgi:hypothetical protein